MQRQIPCQDSPQLHFISVNLADSYNFPSDDLHPDFDLDKKLHLVPMLIVRVYRSECNSVFDWEGVTQQMLIPDLIAC